MKGWEYGSKIIGTDVASQMGQAYILMVNETISDLEYAINTRGSSNLSIPVLQGFLFENWAAETFNVDAIAAGSKDRAFVPELNTRNSVDIHLTTGADYSAKSYKDGSSSAKEQARLDYVTGSPRYEGMGRLVPEDQLDDAIKEAHRQYLRNSQTRPDVATSYKETEGALTDRISNNKGIESKPVSRQELNEIAEERKTESFKAAKHGITTDSAINLKYLFKQATNAGITSAAISVAIRIAPELISIIGYLVKEGEIDKDKIAKLGKDAVSSAGTGFIRGAVSSALYIQCAKGAFGEAFKNISPMALGVAVSLVLDTIWNGIKVAQGKMTALEMGDAFAKSVAITAGYTAGAKIGGMIGQAIGLGAPIIGYIVGSLVGAGACVAYNWSKKKLISVCIDTGFTCFGLVKQDYSIPPEVLKQLGIPFAELNETTLSTSKLDTISLDTTHLDTIRLDIVEFIILRRGLIGVNTVGYVME
ncbi:MAG: hypothetical protein IAA72_01435 [Spirochaetes bacterium]|uniref:Uncharacterized protein n=1 Tax=Candidatus Ornithospirochaeta stercoravium TaxID=2840897 RepID=A0A9D9IAZ4_9SPIO|nr:hypothetical protein [Candidatus Ornithospirochaeta stercoravium]